MLCNILISANYFLLFFYRSTCSSIQHCRFYNRVIKFSLSLGGKIFLTFLLQITPEAFSILPTLPDPMVDARLILLSLHTIYSRHHCILSNFHLTLEFVSPLAKFIFHILCFISDYTEIVFLRLGSMSLTFHLFLL